MYRVVVARVEAACQWLQAGAAGGDWQPLVEYDVLILSDVDASRLVVERVVAPRRIEALESGRDAVVLAIEQRMHAAFLYYFSILLNSILLGSFLFHSKLMIFK